ncbi:MAG: bifunctional (p)ppGpp synthetase/guanosine-3',5'-bis(diphosphate) 3'-pyrophosphohydrolase [Clostridia bacterium]|nr:bifunctional (p)ppGpp synthetase/guanosine-3',5'-bis(diphosphate) 3'-pyrophosphohydrolase [Clostridia bacterium]
MEHLFESAVQFAMEAHRGQKRKDGSVYILHPLEVATIVGTLTNDEALLAAAVLHDTVEDTDVTADDLLRTFGPRVAELVACETEDKRPDMDPRDSWRIRKEESLEVLGRSDTAVKILWLGDKLSNLRALSRTHEKIGDAVFARFNESDPKKQRWYHASVLNEIRELSDSPAYREYEALIHRIFDSEK